MSFSRASAFMVIGALGVLLTMAGNAQQTDPGVQLRAAIEKEEVAGDLEGAMALYRQIIAANGKSRAVAAKAMLRLAGCYEKLGQADARKLYERLVAEYSDQTQEVTSARARLAALAQSTEPQKPTLRKIHVPTGLSMTGSGMLSPDGQTLAFIEDGSLWALPVHGKSDPAIAGAPVRLTKPMHAWDAANVGIAWSGDGKWIAFRVAAPQVGKNAVEELYVIPATGGTPTRVPISWKDWAGDVYTLRYALSAGAETLFFAAGASHDVLRIYAMPVAGGEWRPLTEPTSRQPALSPDGSMLAYVKMQDEGNPAFATKEIWIGPSGGGAGRLVYRLTDGGWVQTPVWSPDGTMLAFLASKSGNNHRQVCILPVPRDGSRVGEVTRFDLPAGTTDILCGWTKDNRLGILIPVERRARLYTVPVSGGKAVQITRADAWMPSWTPDGGAIYFDGIHGGDYAAIEVIPASGGDVRRIPLDKDFAFLQPSYPAAGISPSPDGKTICFAGFYRRGGPPEGGTPGSAIYVLPVEGGRPRRLSASAMGDYQPSWSPDGGSIAFIRREPTPEGQVVANIFVVAREGGEPRRITTAADNVQVAAIDWSPDGQQIAFYGRDDMANPCLRVIAVRGGGSRILVPKITSPGLPYAGITWSPDGKRVAYVSDGVLWTIPTAGGSPTKVETGLDDVRMGRIDWSPDGRTIVFDATSGGDHEFWLMEDFLPLVKAAKK